jgi:aldehyde dehydrogenase (NAD+)
MSSPAKIESVAADTAALLQKLGVDKAHYTGGPLAVRSPITDEIIAQCQVHDANAMSAVVAQSSEAFAAWRHVPAPRRGELVRQLGEALRAAKDDLGRLVTLEVGKIASEGRGEVQEMIDICDFAVGLSRQLYGLTIASERPEHRMLETWHPLGVVGIISAFNFPVAVWSWNSALALVCGNACVWKPSDKTPLTALAVQAIFERVAARFGDAPAGLSSVLIGGRDLGEALVDDPRVALVSATGSTAMGRAVGERAARRFARSILELGGNNAAIVCPSANLALTVRAVSFAAMGTAGQRCTTLRRLFVHEDVYGQLLPKLKAAYASIAVGDPRRDGVLVGPLIDARAHQTMTVALDEARAAGATVTGGAREAVSNGGNAIYVRPAIVEMTAHEGPVMRETFAPILYVMKYREFDDAIRMHNAVGHGLSSSIFTNDLREAERFLGAAGSDCGIVNVNIGPSGAEIGGAFGGEKETGGGRESGSHSWKAYMRRAANTINFGCTVPLSQGVKFDVA